MDGGGDGNWSRVTGKGKSEKKKEKAEAKGPGKGHSSSSQRQQEGPRRPGASVQALPQLCTMQKSSTGPGSSRQPWAQTDSRRQKDAGPSSSVQGFVQGSQPHLLGKPVSSGNTCGPPSGQQAISTGPGLSGQAWGQASVRQQEPPRSSGQILGHPGVQQKLVGKSVSSGQAWGPPSGRQVMSTEPESSGQARVQQSKPHPCRSDGGQQDLQSGQPQPLTIHSEASVLPVGSKLQREMTERPPTQNVQNLPELASIQKSFEKMVLENPIRSTWLSLPDHKEEIQLPLRKGVAREFSNDKICIATNHFPLKLKLPKEVYQYEVEVHRAVDPAKANENPKLRQKGKGKQGEGGGSGSAAHEVHKQLPKRILQKIMKCARVYLTILFERSNGQIGIASDFSTTMYTTKKLEPIGLIHFLDMSQLNVLKIQDPDPDEEEKGTFKITLIATDWEIDIPKLSKYVNENQEFSDPEIMVDLPRVYNAVIKAMPNYKYLAMGKSLLIRFPPVGNHGSPLGGGLTTWPGITACINPGWKFFMNIELAYSTMRVGETVLSSLETLFESDPTNVMEWSDHDIKTASDFLKSAKVRYSPRPGMPRGGTIQRIHRNPPSKQTFEKDGGNITVEKYFKEQYGRKLKFPNGPLLVFAGKGNMVPAELCTIKSGQSVNRKLDDKQTREMVSIARKYPNDLEKQILQKTGELKLNENELFGRFGLTIEDKMFELKCRVLGVPLITYGKPGNVSEKVNFVPEKGAWQVWNRNFAFKKPAGDGSPHNWGILVIGGREDKNATGAFTGALVGAGGKCGLNFSNTPVIKNQNFRDVSRHQENVETFIKIFVEFKKNKCSLVVVVLPFKPSPFYAQVKQAAELSEHGVGILTQCIVSNNFNPRKPKTMDAKSSTVQQLLLKINSKLAGVNHSVTLPPSLAGRFDKIDLPNTTQEAVLVLGADVTHPPPGSGIKDPNNKNAELIVPSFASVTGSLDRTCMPYMMHVQAQRKIGKGAAEVIPNLGEIVGLMIWQFYRRNNTIPGRIIYYRDGVGDGQFQEVLHVELKGIRDACAQFDKLNRGVPYKPKITFITVQKRHKTRFFMHTKKGTENAPPGTVVDSHIVHPTEIDFYLLSHQAIQGTSRPTRYHVLWDDSDFTQDEIQIMTYYMCFMYVRCNRSVKIPAPTYYAHWAAARAKALAEGNENLYAEDLGPLNNKIQRVENFKLQFPMHFI